MIALLPLPDEVAAGHIGRLTTMHSDTGPEDFLRTLRAQTPGPTGLKGIPHLTSLAALCDMDPVEYARQHSMLPFERFLVFGAPNEGRGSGWSEQVVRKHGLARLRSYAYLCPECVQEDQRFWGFSYWRRTHQLPGSAWCEKHDHVLYRASGYHAFEISPARYLMAGKATSCPAARERKGNVALGRLGECCQAMLDGGRSWPGEQIVPILRAKANNLGFRTTISMRSRPLLSDHVFAELPLELLLDLFGGGYDKVYGTYLPAIDGAVGHEGPRTGNAVAVAMALLWPSVEHAFREMFPAYKKQPALRNLPHARVKVGDQTAHIQRPLVSATKGAPTRPYGLAFE